MIREWIQEYKPQNKVQAEAALREIMQEVHSENVSNPYL